MQKIDYYAVACSMYGLLRNKRISYKGHLLVEARRKARHQVSKLKRQMIAVQRIVAHVADKVYLLMHPTARTAGRELVYKGVKAWSGMKKLRNN